MTSTKKETATSSARRRFPPGTPVVVSPTAFALFRTSEWTNAIASGVTLRVVEVTSFRDDEEQPMACVCAPCVGGAIAGWFSADLLMVKP